MCAFASTTNIVLHVDVHAYLLHPRKSPNLTFMFDTVCEDMF